MTPVVSRVIEDYVTLIWKAYEWPGGEATTTEMADRLGVTPSTVSGNLKKLARDGYIVYEPYGRIELTDRGRQLAVGIVRRHRLIETYLVEQLGLTWDQVHDEADRLEHAISDLVLERMDQVLGHPTKDPHGDPIPDVHGQIAEDDSVPLVDAPTGVPVRVSRVSDRSPDVLRYLQEREVTIGTTMELMDVNAAASAVRVAIDQAPIELSLPVADTIRVTPHR